MKMWVIVYEGEQVREEHIFTGNTIREVYDQYYNLCLFIRYTQPGRACKIVRIKEQ